MAIPWMNRVTLHITTPPCHSSICLSMISSNTEKNPTIKSTRRKKLGWNRKNGWLSRLPNVISVTHVVVNVLYNSCSHTNYFCFNSLKRSFVQQNCCCFKPSDAFLSFLRSFDFAVLIFNKTLKVYCDYRQGIYVNYTIKVAHLYNSIKHGRHWTCSLFPKLYPCKLIVLCLIRW